MAFNGARSILHGPRAETVAQPSSASLRFTNANDDARPYSFDRFRSWIPAFFRVKWSEFDYIQCHQLFDHPKKELEL
jgi:hypothetical protein